MKRIFAIALIAAATLIPAGSALAQDDQVKANVPFSFTVGNNTVPAGAYTISSSMNARSVLTLNNRDKDVHVVSLGQPDQSNPKRANEMVFHRYGSQYFLTEIRSADSALNIHFAPSKAEKRIKAQTEDAGLHVNDPVLIALNK
jgi:hypothetical protein